MHTVMIVGGGLALMVACLLLGRAWGGASGMVIGAKFFIVLWLLGAAFNMWLGVSRAGYSVAEEAPIFIGIFGSLAAVAGLVWWKFS